MGSAPRSRDARRSAVGPLLLLAALAAPAPAAGSEGDASPEWRTCVGACRASGCLPLALARWNAEAGSARGGSNSSACRIACPANAPGFTPALPLQLARWDCASDCAYHCMWAVEARRRGSGEGPVWKYVGKWPFVRVLGAQEAASVAFSAANLAAHAVGWHRFAAALPSRGGAKGGGGGGSSGGGGGSGGVSPYPYTWVWALYGAANANAWLWSAVFHTRDTRVTERLDYFSADALVAVGALTVVLRAARLFRPASAAPVAAAIGLGLARHVHYMATVKFDYGYNMRVCIAVGVATALAWVAWAAAVRHPARRRLYAFVAAVHAAMALEVLDFPPLGGLVDAHALWHAATAPLTLVWYDFMVADVAWVTGGGGGGSGAAVAVGDGDSGGSGGRASPGPGGRRRAAAEVKRGL